MWGRGRRLSEFQTRLVSVGSSVSRGRRSTSTFGIHMVEFIHVHMHDTYKCSLGHYEKVNDPVCVWYEDMQMKILQNIEVQCLEKGCVLVCLHALWKLLKPVSCSSEKHIVSAADTVQEWLAHPHLKPLVTVFICPPLCVSFVCCFWFFLCSLCRPDWPWSHSNLSLLPPKWWIKGVCHHQPALCIFFIDPFTVVIYILFSVSLSHRHSLLYHFSQVYCHNW